MTYNKHLHNNNMPLPRSASDRFSFASVRVLWDLLPAQLGHQRLLSQRRQCEMKRHTKLDNLYRLLLLLHLYRPAVGHIRVVAEVGDS